jgi:hypothetical protein
MTRLTNFIPRAESRSVSADLKDTLMDDLKLIKQPDKIFQAYDIFHKSVDQHRTNVLTAVTLVFTSLTSSVGLVQSAYQTADNCPPGADKSTIKACGLAAASVAAAGVGVLMIGVSSKLLIDARSSPGKLANKLDVELEKKLNKNTEETVPSVRLAGLVSRFSELGQSDKELIQNYLSSEMDAPSGQGS